jgi:hypothetical protein
MAGKNTACGIYQSRDHAQRAVEILQERGIRVEDISVLLSKNLGSKGIGTVKATKVPEGAATGASTGAAVGGTLGLLAGIGALTIPGLGPLIAAGPIAVALAGLGAGGAVGGLTGTLVGIGIPEWYGGRIPTGGILVSVHCDNSECASKTKNMLEETGAQAVAIGGFSADFPKTDRPELRRTVDKIRKLAAAGHLRTEISGVLVDAGITDGLQRETQVERSPITINPSPQSPREPSPKPLLQAGFRYVGEWSQTDSGGITLDVKAAVEPGVYVFVLDDAVVYVGLALSGLQERMDQYRRGHRGPKTNARMNSLISASLASGRRVKVLVATPEQFEWHGLPVNMAAGLETGLIQMIQPQWNIQRAG